MFDHSIIYHPKVSAHSVAYTLQIRSSSMLLLLVVGNSNLRRVGGC